MDDELFLMIREVSSLDSWPEIISPSQSATLTASQQTWKVIQLNKTKLNTTDGIYILYIPVLVGTDLQFPGPCSWIYVTKMISSSGVHGPFFTSIFSQHGGLPMSLLFSSTLGDCVIKMGGVMNERKRKVWHSYIYRTGEDLVYYILQDLMT